MISAPAAERNREPILNVLKDILNDKVPLRALEIASGTGQHVTYFANHFRNILWTPSDVDKRYFGSISSHTSQNNLSNVQDPVFIDVSSNTEEWPEPIKSTKFDLIYCANMIHISPFECTKGLFKAAGTLLKPSTGLLITYGPYSEGGVLVPESNIRFNQGLREQNPLWGIRDIDQLIELAGESNLKLIQKIEMPANNKTLVFQKQ